MKATQSIPNFQAKLREYTNFAIREIKYICKEIGPRASGYPAEHKAQEYAAEKLKGFADTVDIEDFQVSTKAFMAWVVIDGLLFIAAAALSFIGIYAVSLACVLVALFFLITEFVMYKQVLDPFFKKYTSCNVVARRAPTGEVKRRVIVSGHMDSSFEWTYNHRGGPVLLKGVMIYAIVGVVYALVQNILGLIFNGAGWVQVMAYVICAFVPGFIAVIFFTNFKVVAPGANDNLTGSFTAVAAMKFLADNSIRFENTEVVTLLTGSEEAGLRGAKYFCKKHLEELSAVETVFFGFDTMRDYDDLAIYSRDLSGTVKHDSRACAILKEACIEAGLLETPFSSVYLGASDSAAVTQAGIPASALAAMDPAPARYYHTREDDIDLLEPKTVEKGIYIALASIFLFDEKGLGE